MCQQADNIQHDKAGKVEGRSSNHGRSGKAKSITHSECVFVALGTQHANCIFSAQHYVVTCGLSGPTIFSNIISSMARFSGEGGGYGTK